MKKRLNKSTSQRLGNIKSDLRISFGLILIAVLVLLAYLFPSNSFLFSSQETLLLISCIVLFLVVLSFIVVISRILIPIFEISHEAQRIAGGEYDREIPSDRPDELGEITRAFNKMTKRMRENFNELRQVQQKGIEEQSELKQRIGVLPNLLQLANLISQDADLKDVIDVSVDECLPIGYMDFGALILKGKNDEGYRLVGLGGEQSEELIDKGLLEIEINPKKDLIGRVIMGREILVIDKNTLNFKGLAEFRNQFNIYNAILIPIVSQGEVYGVVLAGNNLQNFMCSSIEYDIAQTVAHLLTIAIKKDFLAKKVSRLSVFDDLTKLYNGAYAHSFLKNEISRSLTLNRPCSFVLFYLDRFKEYHHAFGDIASESILTRIGSILKDSIDETAKAARFGDYEFAAILPGTSKRQSIELAGQVVDKFAEIFSEVKFDSYELHCIGSVAENPLDGVTAEELIARARQRIREVKQEGGNRVVF